jgi:ribosomal protein L11 methyltransferase
MNTVCVTLRLNNPADADTLTALLDLEGLQGSEEREGLLLAYFPQESYDRDAVQKIAGEWAKWEAENLIAEQNWNAEWESNFPPIRVNDRVNVRAHFHEPAPDVEFDLLITPKMSFGTGHHETTRMMLEYLSEADCRNKQVLDFGCGTGVLAILASRMGAAACVATDNDPWCVDNTRENARANNCSNITASDDTLDALQGPFDLILGNINLNVLLESLPRLYELLKPGGDFYLSGILQSDLPVMENALFRQGFSKESVKTMGQWAAIHSKKCNI